ncbi:unnamed protein product [Gadus morhua 'NCC']
MGYICHYVGDPKGKRFFPFVGQKKRSAVSSNVYIWEPIGPGEELLVRYSVQDNPEITAALEEERVSSLSKKISPELNEDVTFPEVHPSALRVA